MKFLAGEYQNFEKTRADVDVPKVASCMCFPSPMTLQANCLRLHALPLQPNRLFAPSLFRPKNCGPVPSISATTPHQATFEKTLSPALLLLWELRALSGNLCCV